MAQAEEESGEPAREEDREEEPEEERGEREEEEQEQEEERGVKEEELLEATKRPVELSRLLAPREPRESTPSLLCPSCCPRQLTFRSDPQSE